MLLFIVFTWVDGGAHLLTVLVQFALDSLDLFLFLFGLHNTYECVFSGYFWALPRKVAGALPRKTPLALPRKVSLLYRRMLVFGLL